MNSFTCCAVFACLAAFTHASFPGPIEPTNSIQNLPAVAVSKPVSINNQVPMPTNSSFRPENPQVQAAIVGDGVLMIAFEPAFSAQEGTVARYQAYISSDEECPMDSVISVQQSGCCKDEHGLCQEWKQHTRLTCHGLQAGLSYRVNVIVKAPTTGAVGLYAPSIPVEVVHKEMVAVSPKEETLSRGEFEDVVNDAIHHMAEADERMEQNRAKAELQASSGVKPPQVQNGCWWYGVVLAVAVVVVIAAGIFVCKRRRSTRQSSTDVVEHLNNGTYSPILDVQSSNVTEHI